MKIIKYTLLAVSTILIISCNNNKNNMTEKKTQTSKSIDISSSNLKSTNVDITDVVYKDEKATKVKLTEKHQQELIDAAKQKKFIPAHAHAILPVDLHTGIVEFDMAIEINEHANPFSRGFAGLAFRLQPDDVTFEAIYPRGSNGTLNDPLPEAVRVLHGIQYVSEPKNNFFALREKFPEIYEKSARISIDNWHHYKYVIEKNTVSVYIDNAPTPSITVDNQFAVNSSGKLALWLGGATNVYFKKFKVTK